MTNVGQFLMSSYLEKKRAHRRGNTRRWFVVSETHIKWFKDKKSCMIDPDTPLGSIEVQDVTFVRRKDCKVPRKGSTATFSFEIITQNRILDLYLHKEEDRETWINKILTIRGLTDEEKKISELGSKGVSIVASRLEETNPDSYNGKLRGRSKLRILRTGSSSMARDLVHYTLKGPKFSEWTLSYQLLAGLVDELGPLSNKLTWEEMRYLSNSKAAKPKKGDFLSKVIDVDGVKAEFITSTKVKKPEVTVFYLHGGGYCFGSVLNSRHSMVIMSEKLNARFLAVEYSLAPEHPYPTALLECIKVYDWMITVAGLDPTTIVFAGDSAGGGLCTTVLLYLRNEQSCLNLPMPLCALLLCPWVDLSLDSSIQDPENYPNERVRKFLYEHDVNLGLRFSEAYLGEDTDPQDPMVSPVYADLSGLPPLLIFTGDLEPLYPDIVKFANNAKAAGVETVLEVAKDMIHIYMVTFLNKNVPAADRAVELMQEFVHNQLGKKDKKGEILTDSSDLTTSAKTIQTSCA